MPRDNIPPKDGDLLPFAQNLSTRLSATPIPFGCTAAMATLLAGYLSAFSTTLAAAVNPQTRGHSTIFAKTTAKNLLVSYLRLVIRQIQGTSTVTDQQRTDLGITVRKVPTHPADPGTPDRFKVALTTQGALELTWKSTNPTGGTMYMVYRKIGPDGDPVFIGGSGSKKLTDSTLPAGTSAVTYLVQGVRSTGVGAWASFNVNIGVTPAGTATADVAAVDAVKLAA